jgi:glycosyltransferase involved in cell wall biosynthesis
LDGVDPSEESPHDDLRRAHEQLAELERELAVWRVRAEAAEEAVAGWEAKAQRSLWRIFVALDQVRARLAPPETRRDKGVRAIAGGATRALAQVNRRSSSANKELAGRKAVLLVYDESGATVRYRCSHRAEELAFLGMSGDVGQLRALDLTRMVHNYDCFILHRVRWSADVASFLDSARSLGKPVIFDADDLVFEPALFHHFAVLDDGSDDERDSWIRKLTRYRRTLQECNAAIVSTEPLRDYASHLNNRVEVVFNAVSKEMVQLADHALRVASSQATRSNASEVTIAYFSGTPTHNRDFLEAADALLWALETNGSTRFLAVGHLELDARFEAFSSRVRHLPSQPWEALPRLLAGVDINLAPLERDNPVTECKSCVKYLEAALLGVATIASTRDDFVRVIDHGKNGLLADTATEWRESLRRLIESRQLRREIGLCAYEDVRRHHTTEVRAGLLRQVLSALVVEMETKVAAR